MDIYDRHVNTYVNKFMNLDLYRDTFDSFLQLLPLRATILDLGCGPGNVVKYLTGTRSDLHILGIDLAPSMIKEAQKQNPGSEFEVMDIKNAGRIKQQFNAVIAAFCLPYILRVEVDFLFENFKKLTAGNGLVYLSFMEGEKERSGFEKTSFTGEDELYINYYTRDEIELRLKEQGFKTKSFYTKDYPELDGSVTTDLIYIARKTTGNAESSSATGLCC